MLQRSVLQISSRRALRRIPRQISTQIPALLSSRKEFSSVPPKGNASSKPGSTGKPPESGSLLPKVIVGSVAVGAVFFVAYQNGYLDQILGKQRHGPLKEDKIGFEYRDVKDIQKPEGQLDTRGSEELNKFDNQKSEGLSDIPHFEPLSEIQGVDQSQVQDKPDITPVEGISIGPVQEKEVSEHAQLRAESSDQSAESGISLKESPDIKSTEEDTGKTLNEIHTAPVSTQDGAVLQESDTKTLPHQHISTESRPEDTLGNGSEPPGSLLEEYHLKDETEDIIATLRSQGSNGYNHFPNEKEDLISSIGELNDGYITKDGKLVLDFLQAIHAAEKRQAELDARVFAEEKRALKEKYEKELKDAAARELMQAEEVAMLDKDLKRERAKAVLALNALQEKLEEKLNMELKQKEIEEELKLKKLQELAKAELAAAITSEKAAQIEKMAEANLHINALCMAFYARSEEARQSHFAHKLALGAVALEDALSKGLPIQTEIDALRSYLDGGDKDPILDLVLSSLPEETRKNGTDTLLQLNHKFDALKGTLRHFSLIPPGGGGILAHSLAHIASWLKVKEVHQSGDGIESVINRVEGYLAEGKLAEAAAVLEEGVRGTQSAEIVGDWLRQVRNRAITEQALTLLQSYATAISLKDLDENRLAFGSVESEKCGFRFGREGASADGVNVNLAINALCMAFYARSEEARQSHFAHKLALGAVALEDALSKGLPIQTEIDALRSYLDGGDKDPILDLVLSSLPEETRKNGTDTLLQLNHKFDALKGTLRHFSLIPPGGGGILAHSLAHIASWLKVKEVDQSGDGIESVINRVEGFLAEGKLAEAAAVLEEGVRGTQSAEIVGDWLRQVRNRAITEQALTLLQSYATAISLK